MMDSFAQLPGLAALLGRRAAAPEEDALKALLGIPGQASSSSGPVAPSPNPNPTEVDGGEMAVQSGNRYQSRYRPGIIEGGPFRLGSLGGNILGGLGDAFLVQAGRDPAYAPRLQQAREAEAMEDFRTDPDRAIDQLMQINPERAQEVWEQRQEQARQSALDDSLIATRDDTFERNTHQRAGSLLGAATEASYPALRQRYYDYYESRGVEPMVELPENYSQLNPDILRAFVDPDDLARIDSGEARAEDSVQVRRESIGATNSRSAAQRAAAESRFRRSQGQRESQFQRREARQERESQRRAGGGRRRVTVGRRADGTVVVQ